MEKLNKQIIFVLYTKDFCHLFEDKHFLDAKKYKCACEVGKNWPICAELVKFELLLTLSKLFCGANWGKEPLSPCQNMSYIGTEGEGALLQRL